MPEGTLPSDMIFSHQLAADGQRLHMSDVSLELDGQPLIDRISLDLSATGCTTILGPNGAGKSLLLKLMHGVLDPSTGQIAWNGTPAAQATRNQALVFQKPVLLRRSVLANVAFVLKARKQDPARAQEFLEHVGLHDKARQPARLLSGGEQQRLALARALATAPKVLFLDEPTASLDPSSVQRIEGIVQEARARGVRIVFVTHDIGQARRLSDDVLFLHKGRVVEHATADAFFPRPQTREARDHLDGKIVL